MRLVEEQKTKTEFLRLLMREREDVAATLIEIDWSIWKLEESMRRGGD